MFAPGNIAWGLSINWACYCDIYCPDMLKTFQRKNKLFEFSRDTSGEELEIRTNGMGVMILLQ